jgi:plasmid replication initiation protein
MEHLKNGIACQSNKLVEARYSLSPNEQKIIVLMVSLISPNDKDFKEYEIKIADFVQLLNIRNNKAYKETKDLLYRLASRTLFIERENGFLVTGWVSSAEYFKDTGLIKLCFDKKLKPYLLELKKEFTKLDLFTIVRFRSFYTIRIYMLLKQYEKIGGRTFELTDFRAKLGIEKKYLQFKDLRKRVINQAKKELDKKDKQDNFISDISFTFETIKRGRTITRLRFVIYQNTHKNAEKTQNTRLIAPEIPVIKADAMIIDQSPELTQLLEFGVAGASAEAILKKYPIDYIQEKLQLTAEEERKSPVGFFIKAVENDYKSKKIAQEKIKKEKEKKAVEKKQQAEQNELISTLSKEYGRIERESYLNSLTDEKIEKLTETIKQECKKNNNAYGLRFIEAGLALEHNFHVSGYINSRIPDFEEGKHRYVTDKMMEKGFYR